MTWSCPTTVRTLLGPRPYRSRCSLLISLEIAAAPLLRCSSVMKLAFFRPSEEERPEGTRSGAVSGPAGVVRFPPTLTRALHKGKKGCYFDARSWHRRTVPWLG